MNTLFQNTLTASFHGSIVILAVMLLRLVLKKAPRKYICLLWLLAGLRLLMPFQIQSDLSLQPSADPAHRCSSRSAVPRRPPRRKISPRQTWKPPRRCPRRFRISSPPLPP